MLVIAKRQSAPAAPAVPIPVTEVVTRLGIPAAQISVWAPGSIPDLQWDAACVVDAGPGQVGLAVKNNQDVGATYLGGELKLIPGVQLRLGRVAARIRPAPVRPGHAQAFFTFQVPWTAPRREANFELTGLDGRLVCQIQMQPGDGAQPSEARRVTVDVPPGVFGQLADFAIDHHADRVSWRVNGAEVARYDHGTGFDLSVYPAGAPVAGDEGTTLPAGYWNANAVEGFVSHWISAALPERVGMPSAPSPDLMVIDQVTVTEWAALSAFQPGDWSVAPGATDGSAEITVTTVPADDLDATGIEYRVDGSAWSTLGPGPGTYPVSGLTQGLRQIEIRKAAVSPAGDHRVDGPASDTKSVPVAGAGLPTGSGVPIGAGEVQTRIEVAAPGSAQVSTWDAGFPSDLQWSGDCVVDAGPGLVGLGVKDNPGPGRPYFGGEIKVRDPGSFRLGRTVTRAKLTPAFSGHVQAVFTFQAPFTDERREADYEFNGYENRMECTLHMEPLGFTSQNQTRGVIIDMPPGTINQLADYGLDFHADRISWHINGVEVARYTYPAGFDLGIYPQGNPSPSPQGMVFEDGRWNVNRHETYISHWVSPQFPGWIGPLSAPTTELMVVDRVSVDNWTSLAAFAAGDWTLSAAGGGQIAIGISALPADPLIHTAIQYRVNGGGWADLSGTGTGSRTIGGIGSGSRTVELRKVAVSPAGDHRVDGAIGPSKTVTV